MELEEGDIVLCTVDRIVGTIVFVHIEGNGEGSIVVSEIAPGRIRNLRDYVVPKKKIVCKVLRISGRNIDLSLRRVTLKGKKEILEKAKQEKSYESILKSVLKEKADKTIKEILNEDNLFSFLEEAKENSKKLEKLVGKNDSEKILEILNSQKPKKVVVKKGFFLTTTLPDGLEKIKNILRKIKDVDIGYVSAGQYSIKTESENAKEADNKLKKIISDIEKQAKQKNISFSMNLK
jgi:translation initiation factor 2 alpha subunit (eIF-2alpha)